LYIRATREPLRLSGMIPSNLSAPLTLLPPPTQFPCAQLALRPSRLALGFAAWDVMLSELRSSMFFRKRPGWM
jgi:hypothetical protein